MTLVTRICNHEDLQEKVLIEGFFIQLNLKSPHFCELAHAWWMCYSPTDKDKFWGGVGFLGMDNKG